MNSTKILAFCQKICYNNVTKLFVFLSSYLMSIISLEYFNLGINRTFLNPLCFFIMNQEQLEI